MKRARSFVALLAAVSTVAASGIAEVARAAPDTATYDFTGCTGPPGTPSSFSAVRERTSSGSGFRLVNGTAVFVVVIFVDETTGVTFSPPGLSHSGNVTVTCTVISPVSGDTLTLSGFLSPL